MAELTTFAFTAGRSILHRHDVRCKLASLALMTAACVSAPAGGQVLVSLVLAGLVLHLGPVAGRTEEVAEMLFARGLDAGEDACHGPTAYGLDQRPSAAL